MDLRQREMRMRSMNFLGIPAVCGGIHSDLNHFAVGLANPRDPFRVQVDVCNGFDLLAAAGLHRDKVAAGTGEVKDAERSTLGFKLQSPRLYCFEAE